jgi:hypothetical protein
MKFVVMYRVPMETMKQWMEGTPSEEMIEQGKKMEADMNEWFAKHKDKMVDQGLPLGKNTRMTKDGAAAESNDLMMYHVVEAETVEEVVEMFKDNPHFTIPTAYLDIMAVTHKGM